MDVNATDGENSVLLTDGSLLEDPNYILAFNDGVLVPKHKSKLKSILKVLMTIFFIIAWISGGKLPISEISIFAWIGILSAMSYLWKVRGYERRPTPCEIYFYNDYLILYWQAIYYIPFVF